VFVLGLDSLPPKVLYENYGEGLDFIRQLTNESQNYLMKTCHPPITVPAWISMFTGKTPGELGIYGFRHRKPGTFDSYVVNSNDVKEKAIWDDLSKKGVRTGLFGVPPTYPPKPINGFMITDFNTPSKEKPYSFPPWLKSELQSNLKEEPIFDVVYRTEDRDKAYTDLMEMIDNHQRILNYLIKKSWDLFLYVEIGVDRSHHMFWKYFDRSHPRYEYHERFSNAIPTVYRKIDSWFSSLIKELPKDTVYVIVSDHGTKSMKGSYPINQWLIDQGFLKIRGEVKEGSDLTPDIIDWKETKVWAWGGYYSRFFLNIKGREPYGVVEKEEVEGLIKDLKKSISKIRGPNNEIWKNEAYTPQEIYPIARGDAPDLTVYLDDLNWRPIGTIGYKSMYQEKNDKGPDDSMHDWYGVFSIYDPEGTLEKGNKGVIEINKIRQVLEEIVLS
jgi:predicted AlkP superfamily phosphohydrolase/phosphomutase